MKVAELANALCDYLDSGLISPDAEVVVAGMENGNLHQKAAKLLLMAAEQEEVFVTFTDFGTLLQALPSNDGRAVLVCLME